MFPHSKIYCPLTVIIVQIIDFELPITVRLTATDTDPGASDSAQGTNYSNTYYAFATSTSNWLTKRVANQSNQM